MMMPNDYYNVAQAAVSNGTRDAILGMIGGGDVAILSLLWVMFKRMGEIRDELKAMHVTQQSFYKEISK